MTQQQRLLLAIGLSFALITGWQLLYLKPQMEAEQARLAALDSGVQLAEATTDDAGALVPGEQAALLASDGGFVAPIAELPRRTIELTRPTMHLVFTSEGGGLEKAELSGERERDQRQLTIAEGYKKLLGEKFPPGPHVDLAVPVSPGPPQFGVSIAGAAPLDGRLRYAVVEETPGRVTFTGTQGPWSVTKTFSWDQAATGLPPKAKLADRNPAGYVLSLDVTVTNTSAAPASGELAVHTSRAIQPDTETAPSMFGGIGNQSLTECKASDTVHRKTPDDDKPEQDEPGPVHFVALDQQYFLTAVWPKDGAAEGRCLLTSTTTSRSAQLLSPLTVGPGASVTKRYQAFLGPKDLELLSQVGVGTSFQPALDATVDFGWWAVICKALLFFLRFFHGLIGNWGVAIVLLTVMVKVVLLPLTHRAMVSAEQMKKLQPEMEKVRAKYPDDRDQQNQAMMKLYSEAKVNPLGGCLPLLLQLPIWAALFTTLRTSYELYGEPFYGVWSDLTFKDPTYLLPLALGVTMIVTQRLQPQMMDQSQAFIITWVMPVFFTAIMMNYPAGLALYIFTNNLLSIVQQFALRKWLERTGQAAPKKVATT
ncbi:MAG: membrane protein insertase YidC [Archangium sp.]|nr:membrane protein insertase YidC [Archangium sp.]